MTYEAKLTVKFDSKFTHSSYSSYETDTLPEEHYTFEVPVDDLTSTQVFALFKKVMLTMGYDERVIAAGVMSTVFNPDGDENLMRKMCEEYDLTMNEDVGKKVQEEVQKRLEIEKELARVKKGPMDTLCKDWKEHYYPEEAKNDNMPAWGHSDMEALSTRNSISEERDRYKELYFNSVKKIQELTNSKVEDVPGTPGSYRKLYQENLHLKAKISRLERGETPQYTEEEIDAITGAGNTSITLKVLDDAEGTLSFEGYQGQVFAVNTNLSSCSEESGMD